MTKDKTYFASSNPFSGSYMSITGIQGQLLEVTVVGCTKLKDTEWITKQDPYVCLEYASSKFRTRTCKDGGKNPTFQEKFVFTLIEGLRELNVVVWNSNTVTYDDFIGSGKIQLQKVLSQGYDDSSWPLQTKTGRHAGEVRVIMHYSNAHKPAASYAPSAPPYTTAPVPQSPMYSAPPLPQTAYPPASPYPSYPPNPTPSPYSSYPPNPAPSPYYSYPPNPAPSLYSSYPPNPAAYPPSPYPPPQPSTYPPLPYSAPSVYPPPAYPPVHNSAHYPPGPYGAYPPPPY